MRQLLGEGLVALDEFESAAKAAKIGPVNACPDLGFDCDDAAKKPQPFVAVVKAFMEKNGYGF